MLFFGAAAKPCQGQSVFTHLPALTPAYSNNFCADNALPQACISDMLRDKKGRLWLSTCQGMAGQNSMRLLQFDGYNFSPANLANDNFPKPTMAIFKGLTPSGKILGCLETASINTIFLFNPETQEAETLTFHTDSEGVVKDLALRPDGTVVVLLSIADSLSLYGTRFPDFKQKLATWKCNGQPKDISAFGFGLFVSDNEALVAGNNPPFFVQISLSSASVREIPLSNSTVQTKLSSTIESFNDRFYGAFAQTQSSEMFCFLQHRRPQVYVRRTPKQAFEPFEGLPPNYMVRRMVQDSSGNILFLLNDKQDRYAAVMRDRYGKLYDYSAFVAGRSMIHNIRSRDFFSEVFVCAGDGFFYMTTGVREKLPYPVAGNGIRGMLEISPGRFFVTQQGASPVVYDHNLGTVSSPQAGSNLIKAFGYLICWKFMPDPEGQFWTFRSDTLVRFDPKTGTHRDYARLQGALIYERLSDGRVAFCSREKQGLFLHNPVTGVTQSWESKTPFLGLSQGFVHDIRQSKDGKIWIMSTNGLIQIDLKTGKEAVFGFEAPFRDSRFLCMAEASDGKLWFGTFLGGIHILEPVSGAIKVADKEQGLPSNTIAFIMPDGAGNMLAGTYNGLSMLNQNGAVISNYSLQEGFSEAEFNRFAFLRAQNGDYLLGTVRGLQVLPADYFQKKASKEETPQLYLTGIDLTDPSTGNNRNIRTGFERLPLLELPPEHRAVNLRFALSNYTQPQRNQFAYMLEGLNDSWIQIGSQHELRLSNLPAGRYTLVIKGCDFQGNCTVAPIRIPIHAREFFYKQAWFYVLCAMPFAAFAIIWVRHLRSEKKRLEKEVQRRTQQIQRDKALIEQQARELMQLDEAKSRFFTNISHELRTPITLITAPVEYLIQKFHPDRNADNEERQSLQRVLYNGQKLAALVEELLELSRLEAGKTELFETPTELYPWVRQLFSAFESQAEMKRIDYQLSYEADPALTLGVDRKRLEKIINNLIGNALKFTHPYGKIIVSVSERGAANPEQTLMEFQVADTGRGIPTEDLPHLFERYFQTKRSDMARSGGTGIGLALAKELALLMKGDLTVESEWKQGSRFTLRLPLKKMAGLPKPQQEMPESTALLNPRYLDAPLPLVANGEKDRGERILIVEDNSDMQALLKSLLSKEYQLTVTNDGQEAWELLENTEGAYFSLILSDVMMPRMDGYELLGKLKAHPRWSRKPVILLTARAEPDDKIQALRLGVDDYLVKPFSPPELLARVSNLIANYRSRLEENESGGITISFEETTAHDDLWLENIEAAAKRALDKGLPLQVGYLVEAAAMSERQFFREMKRLTGITPNQYIQEVRLQKARHLLQHRAYNTISEVAYAVGFETPTYFTRVFEQHFGKHPSDFLRQSQLCKKEEMY